MRHLPKITNPFQSSSRSANPGNTILEGMPLHQRKQAPHSGAETGQVV
jgi:hypothetical protein